METYNHEFDELRKNNIVHRLVSQLKYCKDCDKVDEKKIKEILNDLSTTSSMKKTNTKVNLQEHLAMINSHQYMKNWHLLKSHQKEDRLAAFIIEKKIGKELQQKLMYLLEKDIIKPKKTVTYDKSKGILTDLECLTDDEGVLSINKKYTKILKKLQGDTDVSDSDDDGEKESSETKNLKIKTKTQTKAKPNAKIKHKNTKVNTKSKIIKKDKKTKQPTGSDTDTESNEPTNNNKIKSAKGKKQKIKKVTKLEIIRRASPNNVSKKNPPKITKTKTKTKSKKHIK